MVSFSIFHFPYFISREHFSRLLGKMEREGALRRYKGRLIFPTPERLRARAGNRKTGRVWSQAKQQVYPHRPDLRLIWIKYKLGGVGVQSTPPQKESSQCNAIDLVIRVNGLKSICQSVRSAHRRPLRLPKVCHSGGSVCALAQTYSSLPVA